MITALFANLLRPMIGLVEAFDSALIELDPDDTSAGCEVERNRHGGDVVGEAARAEGIQ